VATYRIITGDVHEQLATLDPKSIQTCVTSPPYWGLRDYGTGDWDGGDPNCDHGTDKRGARLATTASSLQRDCTCGAIRVDSQIGMERTPEAYVENMVEVFRGVKRALRDDGTAWLNVGDSYSSHAVPGTGIKEKDLCLIPSRLALALQEDGWYIRADVIWAKPNSMPESVTDRPTRAHEFMFLLAKNPQYFYDYAAIREGPPRVDGENSLGEKTEMMGPSGTSVAQPSTDGRSIVPPGRNRRTVWNVSPSLYRGAHFATFPTKLVDPCVLAGSSSKACGECGSPWKMGIERGGGMERDRTVDEGLPDTMTGHGFSQGSAGYDKHKEANPDLYTGWESECAHDDDSGCSVVLDPFCGSGTTGVVALRHGRDFVGIELNPEFVTLAKNRIYDDGPLLNTEA